MPKPTVMGYSELICGGCAKISSLHPVMDGWLWQFPFPPLPLLPPIAMIVDVGSLVPSLFLSFVNTLMYLVGFSTKNGRDHQ